MIFLASFDLSRKVRPIDCRVGHLAADIQSPQAQVVTAARAQAQKRN
jgi:hypothetical protein